MVQQYIVQLQISVHNTYRQKHHSHEQVQQNKTKSTEIMYINTYELQYMYIKHLDSICITLLMIVF